FSYRYSTRGFYDWSQVAKYNEPNFAYAYDLQDKSKEEYQLLFSQRLPGQWGQLFFSGARRYYWDMAGKEDSWNFGYGNNWKRLTYQAGVRNVRYVDRDRWETEYYFNISLPLSHWKTRPHITAYYNKTKNDGEDFSTTLSGAFGEEQQYGYAVTAGHVD